MATKRSTKKQVTSEPTEATPFKPTQPENEREAKQLLLRVLPSERRDLEDLARLLGVTMSEAAALAWREKLERLKK